MRNAHASGKRSVALAPAPFLFAACAWLFLPFAAARAQDLTAPLDENSLFGGSGDIVTNIDTQTAAAGTVELVKDTKTYPVFLVQGDAGGGVYGSLVPYGASSGDSQSIFGAISLNGFSVDFLPSKDLHFDASLDGIFMPGEANNVTASAYADLRASEFTRLYAAGTYKYKPTVSYDPLGTTQDSTLSLDELFVDTALSRKFFFRIGKQRVSWGVGNWYKPADVLSLAAINPDDPTAAREGPYAFKMDAPFGTLNQATLYVVPPLNGDASGFSLAGRADIVVSNFELNFGAFGRTDMEAKPRVMFMFTGAVGPFDVYGENVVAYGSDRTYVKSDGSGGYELYTVDALPIVQSTLGIKYNYSNSNGFSFAFHVQGYYNGSGYQDSSLLQIAAARKAIKENAAYKSTDLLQAGMYYLAGNASIGGRWGEGEKLTQWTLSSYALANFSDMSYRLKPSFALSIGDQGSKLDMTLSALTTMGDALSEYAPKGNTVTPDLEMTILQHFVASVSAPILLNADYSLKKAGLNFSLIWYAVSF